MNVLSKFILLTLSARRLFSCLAGHHPATVSSPNCSTMQASGAASPEAELEFAWRAFTNLNEWVRFSDAKAAAVLAADGAIVGAIATWLAGSRVSVTGGRLAVAWLALVICAAFYSASQALRSLIPRLSTSEEASSLVFFSHIARDYPSSDLFISKLRQAISDPDRAINEIGQQIWANSQVAAVKYRHVEKALKSLSWAVYVGFSGIIILVIVRIIRPQ